MLLNMSGWWYTSPSENYESHIPNCFWKVIKFHGSKPPTRCAWGWSLGWNHWIPNSNHHPARWASSSASASGASKATLMGGSNASSNKFRTWGQRRETLRNTPSVFGVLGGKSSYFLIDHQVDFPPQICQTLIPWASWYPLGRLNMQCQEREK